MSECKVKDLVIGQGKPKVCLPIVGVNNEEILETLKKYQTMTFDLIELRIDFYQDIHDLGKVNEMLKMVKENTNKPILFTYRSLREGGQIQLSNEEYCALVECACQSGCVDLIDIELMSGKLVVYQLVEMIHQHHLSVIMSYHNFDMTPDSKDLQEYLESMEVLDADILKIAVMPQSREDVVRLMTVTAQMSEKINRPLVTMSMGKLGVVTRISGELTGSSITFASGGKASAPGQIGVDDMNDILEVLHCD